MVLPAAVMVLGAFLLFLVQPLMGRFVLPWFGGTPAVWTVCLLFFQAVLLCGYAYAHASVARFRPRAQVAIHLVLLLLSLGALPVIPDQTWRPEHPAGAEFRILMLLTVVIGLPVFLLSTTAPLLQAWNGRLRPDVSPYRLYAWSNLAAFAGLLVYPFLIEPVLTLREQALSWSAAYALFTLVCAGCALRQWRMPFDAKRVEPTSVASPTRGERGLCFAWSICGTVLLYATTSHLSQNVAAVPLLWVVPLSFYLLTFALCFDHPRWYSRTWCVAALPVAIACALAAPYFGPRTSLLIQLPAFCLTLVVGCTICHGELARLKPATPHLTGYFLRIATGGVLGGLLCSMLAPMLFNGLWEYPCGIAMLVLLEVLTLTRGAAPRFRLRLGSAWAWALVAAVALGAAFTSEALGSRSHTLHASRNFFGVLEVDQVASSKGPVRCLVHGRVTHGLQFRTPALRRIPTAYYGVQSGLGLAANLLRSRANGAPLSIGAIGLGVGTLAAYGQPGDTIRFYEINPEVARLAAVYFTYLGDTPARVEMCMGDARIVLEGERERGEMQRFDLLVLDAFNGDAVPLHLLTREAFRLYAAHLRPDGLLAVHITNRHLELAPLILGLARDAGAEAVLIDEPANEDTGCLSNRWVLVARDATVLQAPEIAARAVPAGNPENWVCFTDDYANLFQLLRW